METGVAPPSDASGDTIFGKIIRGEIPCDKVYEDEQCLAFRDISPVAQTHVLVIPKVKISQLSLGAKELGETAATKELLGHLMLVAAQIGRDHCPGGCRYVINDGKEGCQVPHALCVRGCKHVRVHACASAPACLCVCVCVCVCACAANT